MTCPVTDKLVSSEVSETLVWGPCRRTSCGRNDPDDAGPRADPVALSPRNAEVAVRYEGRLSRYRLSDEEENHAERAAGRVKILYGDRVDPFDVFGSRIYRQYLKAGAAKRPSELPVASTDLEHLARWPR